MTMPKKKAAKKSSFAKFKSLYSHHKVVGSIFLLAGVWAIVWLGQVGVERYKFYQAERKLDKLAAEVQTKLGDEVKLKKERVCDYASEKYGRGPRGCSIYYTSQLTPIDPEKSSTIAENLLEVSMNTNEFNNKKVSLNELPFNQKFEGFNPGLKKQEVFIYLSDLNRDPFCSSSAVYEAYSQASKDLGGEDNLKLVIGCNGAAKWEYFPIRN